MNTPRTMILLSYICIATISAAIITPALPMIEREFALGHGALEWVVSIFLLGYVIGQLIYGPLANRFGRLNALRVGLIVNILGILVCIIAVKSMSYSLLLLGRLITALGSAAGLTCTFILINELLTEEKAKKAMSYATISFTLGAGLAVTIGGLVTQYLHWQDCFIILLVHGFLMLALSWQFKESLENKTSLNLSRILSGYWEAIKNSRLLVNSLVVGFVSAFIYGYSATAPLYAHMKLHFSPATYGYWNLFNMVGMLASGFVAAKLIIKLGPKRHLFISLTFVFLCLISLDLIAYCQTNNAIWFFGTTALFYFFNGLLFPTASFFASNAIKDRASASSMMSFINMGSSTLTVVIIGYSPFTSIRALAMVISCFFMLILFLILWLARKEEDAKHEQT